MTATYSAPLLFSTAQQRPAAAAVGSAQFAGLTQTSNVAVIQASTTTTVVPTPASTQSGQSVTLTATVKPVDPATGAPTGTVTFTSGSATLCSAVAVTTGSNQSVATCSTTTLSVGIDTVEAAYSGDVSFLASAGTTTVAVITLPVAGAGPPSPIAPAWPAGLAVLPALLAVGALGLHERKRAAAHQNLMGNAP